MNDAANEGSPEPDSSGVSKEDAAAMGTRVCVCIAVWNVAPVFLASEAINKEVVALRDAMRAQGGPTCDYYS